MGFGLALGLTLGLGFELSSRVEPVGLITTKGLYSLTSIIFSYIETSLLNKFKTNSLFVGGRHYSGTNNISGAITSKGTNLLRVSCTKCRRNKSMTVSDATIETEGLKDFFESVGRATVNFGKKVSNSPVRALKKQVN